MDKIKQIIVVEGKHDTARLRQFFDCDTIETGGNQISPKTIERIQAARNNRGVIIFTDPDYPGERIRRIINNEVDGCQNAFISKNLARTERKVGIEHAGKDDLYNSLSNLITFEPDKKSLEWNDFIDLNLMGNAQRREKVCEAFHFGRCNAKTCFARLNQLSITRKQIEEVLDD